MCCCCRAIEQDMYGFVAISVYVGYYAVRAGWERVRGGKTGSPVNPVAATMVLIAMWVHRTLDNRYSVVGAWLIGARLLNKLNRSCMVAGGVGVLQVWDMLMDGMLLSVLMCVGVVPYHGDAVMSGLYAMQGVSAAMAANQLMMVLEGEK